MKNRIHRNKRRRVQRRRLEDGSIRACNYLLTRNEGAFFRVLALVLGDRFLISCKVRLADIITCSDRDWDRGCANRFSQKHIDFVVTCAKSLRILAGIELDDRSHLRRELRARDTVVDQLFQQARVRLIRVPARWEYHEKMVIEHLRNSGLFLKNEIDPGSISPKPTNLQRNDY